MLIVALGRNEGWFSFDPQADYWSFHWHSLKDLGPTLFGVVPPLKKKEHVTHATMNNLFRLLVTRLRLLTKSLLRSIESTAPYSDPKFIAVGAVGVVGFPLYYLVWHDMFPQPYENLPLRLLGGALFVPLILVKFWPQKLRRFLPIYWYAAIWFALPFFFIFMFLKNAGSHAWAMSVLSAVFLMTLLVDWRSLVVMFGIGIVVGWLAYYATTHPIASPTLYGADLAVFLFAIVGGSIVNMSAERVVHERLAAMLTAANNIAHELRTPLLSIKCTAMGNLAMNLIHVDIDHSIGTQNRLDIPVTGKIGLRQTWPAAGGVHAAERIQRRLE